MAIRQHDWESRLAGVLRNRFCKPMVYGSNDCVGLVASACLAVTGVDVLATHAGDAAFVQAWDNATKDDMSEVLNLLGVSSLQEALDLHFKRKQKLFASSGDPCSYWRDGDMYILGVIVGGGAFFFSPERQEENSRHFRYAITLPLSAGITVWDVETARA